MASDLSHFREITMRNKKAVLHLWQDCEEITRYDPKTVTSNKNTYFKLFVTRHYGLKGTPVAWMWDSGCSRLACRCLQMTYEWRGEGAWSDSEHSERRFGSELIMSSLKKCRNGAHYLPSDFAQQGRVAYRKSSAERAHRGKLRSSPRKCFPTGISRGALMYSIW